MIAHILNIQRPQRNKSLANYPTQLCTRLFAQISIKTMCMNTTPEHVYLIIIGLEVISHFPNKHNSYLTK